MSIIIIIPPVITRTRTSSSSPILLLFYARTHACAAGTNARTIPAREAER
jgi:hypothetical protein